MRVSLIIDGDASGAEKAADSTSRAIGDLGKESEAISKAIEDGFNKAIGAFGKLSDKTSDIKAANDNAAGSAGNLVNVLIQVAGKATDADSALGKAAAGAGGLAKGFFDLIKTMGTANAIGAAFGLANTLASTFYSIVNAGGADANRKLDEQGRLIGVIRDAYRDASKTAGEFYTQSAAITRLQTQQNLIQLQAEQKRAASGIIDRLAPTQSSLFSGSIPGEAGMNNGLAGALFPDQGNARFQAFQGAFDNLRASVAAGTFDITKFREEVAAIGNAAASTSPEIAKLANTLVTQTKAEGDVADGVAKFQAIMAMLNGTATEQQRKLLGISTSASQASTEYDRLTKSLQRQAAAQEAEVLTVGKSAGEAASLRTQYLLKEAATQSGIKATGEYAKAIDNLANRFGRAGQAAAEASLKSNAAFDLSQLGRTSIDANVAAQLHGAYGDNVAEQMNGALAASLRFNESMKDIKATTTDLASGLFRDIRTQIQSGASAWQAFGTAGVNALNKIIDKIGDKAIDTLISKLFGAAGGSGSGGIIGAFGKLLGFDSGGYTGPGGRLEPAGIVHKGEVVFSQADVRRHGGVAVVEAMRRGLPGYDTGGIAGGAPSPLRFLGSSSSAAGPQTLAPQRVQLDVNVYLDDDGKLGVIAREAGRSGGQEAADVRVRTFSKHELPDRVQQIQRNPRNRG